MDNKNFTGKSPRTPSQSMLRRTLFLLVVCGIVAFIVLGARLYKLQIMDHDYYENLAIEQQVRETTVSAARGTIYDRTGKTLAMSASVDTIYISPAEIKMYGEDTELIARGLSEILGVDYDSVLLKTTDTKSWYKTVATKVEQEVADQVREFKNQYGLNGVKIEADTKRYYPYGSLACHIIGFVGTDNYGLAGIELKYNDDLTGAAGRIVRAKNSAGTDMLFTKYEDYYDAENGSDVILTLDSTIQYYLEKHLKQAVEDYDVQSGAAAIAMDVNTGGILGLVSLNNFDLNNFQMVGDDVQELMDSAETEEEAKAIRFEAQQRQWRDKAISDTYEPGSTFKILTLAMALNENVVNPNAAFYCGGNINVLGRDDPLKCWKTIGHGSQTLTQAIQHSCNVALVQIGQLVGEEKFYQYCEAFGFLTLPDDTSKTPTAKTGIDLPGESGSIWWPQDVFCDKNNLSQLAAASFGQTFTITPMQLITAVSACVNGGYLMKPYLVDEVVAPDGTVVSKTESQMIRQVISEETSKTVCGILEQVVGDNKEGTGKNAYVAGYRIGGKTGTSTKTTLEVDTGEKDYIVSFIGFAPADDPQIAVLILLDSPSQSSGIYISGGQMAAPVVGRVFADILPYMGVEAVYTDDEVARLDKTVPDIAGMTVGEAEKAIKDAGLTFRLIGEGAKVTSQLPAPHAVVAAGSQIIIYADAVPSEELEEVPDLTGLSYSVARQRLGYLGLFIKTGSSIASDSETVVVISQSVGAGERVGHGTVIEVSLVDSNAEDLGRY